MFVSFAVLKDSIFHHSLSEVEFQHFQVLFWRRRRRMMAEPWLLKMGSQVSSNLKHALYLETSAKSSSKKQGSSEKKKKKQQTLKILAFEVANVMCKVVHLYKSLTDTEVLKLKGEILNSKGIKTLVSSDERHLLDLALVEKLDDLNRVASVVSRLGKRCTIPALQGFEHVYGDIVSGEIDIKELGFLVKDMDGAVRKMERFVGSTASLHAQMEVMNELESATKKFQENQLEETRKAFEQKLMWQKQDVKHLQEVSLWDQTYDKATELLARTVCTIYARIYFVFGDDNVRAGDLFSAPKSDLLGMAGKVRKDGSFSKPSSAKDGERSRSSRPQVGLKKNEEGFARREDYKFICGNGPGRLFMECLSLRNSASNVEDQDNCDEDDDESSQVSGFSSMVSDCPKKDHPNSSASFILETALDRCEADEMESKGSFINSSKFGPKSKLLDYAPPTTAGGSSLALHYANIVIVLEKLLRYPHLVGDEARDDLYKMLPLTLRKTLKAALRPYAKGVAIYDAHLAHDWREKLDSVLEWIVPLAHSMMRWQSERNFERRRIVSERTTSVVLLQTLYFADRAKTEAVICELLVGLNYICRYEQQQSALLDCASSFDLGDCAEWPM